VFDLIEGNANIVSWAYLFPATLNVTEEGCLSVLWAAAVPRGDSLESRDSQFDVNYIRGSRDDNY